MSLQLVKYSYTSKLGFGEKILETLTWKLNTTIFEVEENFRPEAFLPWLNDNFWVTYYAVVIYLAVIFALGHFMKSREKFDLRRPLTLWNFGLALFSILGAMRVIPELLNTWLGQQNGFYHSVCSTGILENKAVTYWFMLFVLSKLVELGDTVFIVLRKQPLIFLHWYHHVTVLVFTWYASKEYSSLGRWYISLNYFVHSLMYTYYGLKALQFKIPKPVAVTITSLQLLQMIVGLTVTLAAVSYKIIGLPCATSNKTITLSLLIYFSYGVLFAHFFYNAYLAKKTPQPKSVPTGNETSARTIKKHV